jgi:hypothetical protein
MTALLLGVFFLQLIIHLVNSVGVATINEIVCIHTLINLATFQANASRSFGLSTISFLLPQMVLRRMPLFSSGKYCV